MSRLDDEFNSWFEEERKPIADLEYSIPLEDEEDKIKETEQIGVEEDATPSRYFDYSDN